ncbi:MAG: hypothetical protein AAF487_06280 [Bacteroidota bacterium]
MKGEWTKILVFGIIFLILGFLLGRVTCTSCCSPQGKEVRIQKMMLDGEDFSRGGSEDVEVIVKSFEGDDFKGDTTVAIEGGEIQISRSGDEIEVEVEISDDGTERIEKKVIKKVVK